MNTIIQSIINPAMNGMDFIICTATSLLLGLILAFVIILQKDGSRGFIIAVCVLPFVVQSIIMVVNGNIGTGITVVGAFSLIRFRSLPGNAKNMVYIFLAMTIGIIVGGGFLGIAAVVTALAIFVNLIFTLLKVGEADESEKTLKITIPENLDYSEIFTDLFSEYMNKYELLQAKTTNMGSLYQITYSIILKDSNQEKELIDKIRCRNGNLEIVCSRVLMSKDEL